MIRGGEQAMFTDLQGLNRLREMNRNDDPEALQAVARQFESIFTHMMLKSMRSASFGNDLTGGYQMDFYRDMFDQQIAVEMSESGGIGLADMIARELGGTARNASANTARSSLEALRQRAVTVMPETDPAASAPAARGVEDMEPGSPRAFVERLLPAARPVAERLGVEPQLILAQAALETGWGRSMIRDGEGRNSFNLFGIKAGRDWQGPAVTVPTMEFEQGLPVRRMDQFRAYASPSDSLADYARLLENSPRYQEALGQGNDARAFGEALQAGGYATDPEYAEKIERVAQNPVFREIATNGDRERPDWLKNFPDRPFE